MRKSVPLAMLPPPAKASDIILSQRAGQEHWRRPGARASGRGRHCRGAPQLRRTFCLCWLILRRRPATAGAAIPAAAAGAGGAAGVAAAGRAGAAPTAAAAAAAVTWVLRAVMTERHVTEDAATSCTSLLRQASLQDAALVAEPVREAHWRWQGRGFVKMIALGAVGAADGRVRERVQAALQLNSAQAAAAWQ